MAIIISSQRYLDDGIVERKRREGDYAVTLSPEFEIDGESYQVVLDGHHSLAAAKANGIAPDFTIADAQTDDRVSLARNGDIEAFLLICRMDSDYYDIADGRDVW